ncbi:Cytoplasmic tRNA 2-thiolation protein 1 [Platanthera guangdongensis]|uniref:Cytoplasmic tRNA 2-thiolation protein 1 n=1 Tax=Platanthera guangdongensis TaxID=2320717 RepID=A0ABR2LBW5_9ASPA
MTEAQRWRNPVRDARWGSTTCDETAAVFRCYPRGLLFPQLFHDALARLTSPEPKPVAGLVFQPSTPAAYSTPTRVQSAPETDAIFRRCPRGLFHPRLFHDALAGATTPEPKPVARLVFQPSTPAAPYNRWPVLLSSAFSQPRSEASIPSLDSTVLAYVLSELNRRHGYGLDLFLLSVDEGITGYRDDSLETVKRNEHQMLQKLSFPMKESDSLKHNDAPRWDEKGILSDEEVCTSLLDEEIQLTTEDHEPLDSPRYDSYDADSDICLDPTGSETGTTP